eukprot:CFRG1904T1
MTEDETQVPSLVSSAASLASNVVTSVKVGSKDAGETYSRLVFDGTVLPPPKIKGPPLFNSLPDQNVNRRMLNDYSLSILLMGETAIGKSTLVDNLFNAKLSGPPSDSFHKKVFVDERCHVVEERNIRLKVNLAEVKGFGDQIDCSNSLAPVINYIETKYEEYLAYELQACRTSSPWTDRRVHLCLYLITPNGRGLRNIDVDALKQLGKIVNVVPLIAKAESFTKAETANFKKLIRAQVDEHDIKVYLFDSEEEEFAVQQLCADDIAKRAEALEEREDVQAQLPFAVSASNDITDDRLHRKYPWGTTKVESEAESDFNILRKAILRLYTNELVHSTNVKHYENFRTNRMLAMGFLDKTDDGLTASLKDMYDGKNSKYDATKSNRLSEMTDVLTAKKDGIVLELDKKFQTMQSEWQAKIEAIKLERQEVHRRTEQLKTEVSIKKRMWKKPGTLEDKVTSLSINSQSKGEE